jgi:hypothetical protein
MNTTTLPPLSSMGLSTDARLLFAMLNMKEALVMLARALDSARGNEEKAELFLRRANLYFQIVWSPIFP